MSDFKVDVVHLDCNGTFSTNPNKNCVQLSPPIRIAPYKPIVIDERRPVLSLLPPTETSKTVVVAGLTLVGLYFLFR